MHRKFRELSILSLILVFLAGCTISATAPPTASPNAATLPTQTASPRPSSTEPPTATSRPTRTPMPPRFQLPTGEGSGYLDHRMNFQPMTAFSPNGDMLAIGSRNGQIMLWDMVTGEQLQIFEPSEGQETNGKIPEVAQITFSPDGELLAAAKPALGLIEIWNVAAGEQVVSLEGGDNIRYVEFSPDGLTLAGGIPRIQTISGKVLLWETSSWAIQHVLEAVAPPVAFSQDSVVLTAIKGEGLIPSGVQPGSITLWDVSTGQQIRAINLDSYIGSIDYNSEHQLLAANIAQTSVGQAGYVTTTLLIDATTGNVLHSLDLVADGTEPLVVSELTFSPDASLLAVSYQPNRVVVWDVTTGTQVRVLDGSDDWLRYPVFSPDGTLLAASSSDGRILFWKIEP